MMGWRAGGEWNFKMPCKLEKAMTSLCRGRGGQSPNGQESKVVRDESQGDNQSPRVAHRGQEGTTPSGVTRGLC